MPTAVIIIGLIGLGALAIYGSMNQSVAASINSGIDAVTGGSDVAPDTTNDGAGDPIAIALPLIEQFEGFSATAYNDPPGSSKYSIGYGHQIKAGESYNSSSTIGKSEAQDLLRVDVGAAWTCVYQNVKVDCSPQQYAALISLCFNIGCTAFKNSTLVRDLNNGDTASAADQFSVWNKAGGQVSDALVGRRQQEQQLFQSGTTA